MQKYMYSTPESLYGADIIFIPHSRNCQKTGTSKEL